VRDVVVFESAAAAGKVVIAHVIANKKKAVLFMPARWV
jgi:hypothetical protein